MNIYNWHSLNITPADLTDGKLQEFSVAEKRVGLVLKDGDVFAFSATCPHAGVSLCDGWMDVQGRIVCPLHKYRFDPKNGRNTSGEGYKLRTYPVEIREGYIYIGLQS